MKRILIRGGMTPFENYDAPNTMLYNPIGNNSGNMLYVYSVVRAIYTSEEIRIDADHYVPESRHPLTDEEMDRINEQYDLYVLPLANAFRYKLRFVLQRLTDFINRLKIPVILIGIGVSQEHEDGPNATYRNDDTVRAFIRAVLGKSSVIGTRGEITRDYLVHLGFQAETDVTAIGCPSAYTFGPDIHIRAPELGGEAKLLINKNPKAPEQVRQFLRRTAGKHKNAFVIQQTKKELMEMFLGCPYNGSPQDESQKRFFLNMPAWFEFTGDAGLSVGSRLHGNVVPTLGGTPSVFIPIDIRMRELVDYHDYASVDPAEVKGTRTYSLRKLLEHCDFQAFERRQPENFAHYLAFLKKNQVETIYDNGQRPARGDTSFDRKIAEIQFEEPVLSSVMCDEKQIKKRWSKFEGTLRAAQIPLRAWIDEKSREE